MQQVNLYTDAFRPKKVVLPLEQILLLPVLTLFILVGITVWLNLSMDESNQKITHQEAKIKNLQDKLGLLEEKAKLQRKDDSLVMANLRLIDTIKARQQMIEVLDTVVVKDDEGFSGFLLSLARQKVEGLWLNAIKIGASGKEMTLEGTTLNANAVPEYLQNLRKEPSFMGRSFTVFEMGKVKKNPKQLVFSLRSEISQAEQEILANSSMTSILRSNINAGLQP